VIIRAARADDVPAMAELTAASYRQTFGPIIGEAGLALRDPAYFNARFTDELAHFRIALDDGGGPAGLAEVRAGTLDMLFVDPVRTGRRIGALLLQDAERRGAVRLECFDANTAARRFYARHGWVDADRYERSFAGCRHTFVAMVKA
jgi:putative acetyltransferase